MKCNLKGCERTDEHEHGQSAYTAAGQTELVASEDDFVKLMGESAKTAFDPGPGGYWAYLDESLEGEGAREATDGDLVALFRAGGESWVVAMPRGVWKKFRETGSDPAKLDELLAKNRYEPTPEKK